MSVNDSDGGGRRRREQERRRRGHSRDGESVALRVQPHSGKTQGRSKVATGSEHVEVAGDQNKNSPGE